MSDESELQTNLKKGFKDVINQHFGENEANVPDFILAEYLVRCFNIFNNATQRRDNWYGVHLEPVNSHFIDPPKSESGD
jgi:hypothetical protein